MYVIISNTRPFINRCHLIGTAYLQFTPERDSEVKLLALRYNRRPIGTHPHLRPIIVYTPLQVGGLRLPYPLRVPDGVFSHTSYRYNPPLHVFSRRIFIAGNSVSVVYICESSLRIVFPIAFSYMVAPYVAP